MQDRRQRDEQRDAEFTDFVTGSQQRLHRQALLLTGDPGEAQDLVQVTLERVYVAWRRIEEPGAYAHRTMVNGFVRDRRRARRERELLAVPDGARHERQPDHAITVMDALRALPPRMRAVVVLRYWEGESVARTADVLSMTESNVKSTAARALARLREQLGESFDERVSAHASHDTEAR